VKKESFSVPSLVILAAALITAFAHPLAHSKSCKLLALQQSPCDLVPIEVVSKALGVAVTSLQVEDNVQIMSITGAEKTSAQAQAAETIRGLQCQPVAGLGDKASVMYGGSTSNAHLITLVKGQTIVVQVRMAKAPREKNLELAKPIAAAVVARCS